MLKNRTHKVGTMTLGITLVISGIAFLLHLFFPALSYAAIMKAWPLVFIFLGSEILFGAIHSTAEDDPMIYDKAAIFITALVLLFAMFIGCISMLMEQYMYHSF